MTKQKKSPHQKEGANNHSLTAYGEVKPSTKKQVQLLGELAKAPIDITDPNYPVGACIKCNGKHLGLRLNGLAAATIKRLPVGCTLKVSTELQKRVNGAGKLVVCFCVTDLKRVKL